MTTSVVASVSRIAAGQWGLLTTAQGERGGITRLQLARLADAGVLERQGRGVYATTSALGDEYLGLRAAWLTLDPASTAEERLSEPTAAGVVSHASAAALHHLGDLLHDEHEFTLQRRRQTKRGGIRIHRGDLTTGDVTVVEGLPITTEERTIADLLRAGSDPEHIAHMIGQGVRRGVVDPSDLAVRLEPLARRHGQGDGDALVEHLLDLVGLSRAALTRDLVQSPVGQELVAAARLSGVWEGIASMLPTIDTAQLPGPGTVDVGRLAGIQAFLARMPPLNPAIAQVQLPSWAGLTPSMQAAIAALQTPMSQQSITAAQSPTVAAFRRSLASDEDRRASRADSATPMAHHDGDEE